MATPQTVRRHRAGENPNGRPARDLVDAYFAAAPPRTPVPA